MAGLITNQFCDTSPESMCCLRLDVPVFNNFVPASVLVCHGVPSSCVPAIWEMGGEAVRA